MSFLFEMGPVSVASCETKVKVCFDRWRTHIIYIISPSKVNATMILSLEWFLDDNLTLPFRQLYHITDCTGRSSVAQCLACQTCNGRITGQHKFTGLNLNPGSCHPLFL